MTTVYCFPGKWQQLEDGLWTQLDDCLNVDQQRMLRRWLPVTGTRPNGGMGVGFAGGMGGGLGGISGGPVMFGGMVAGDDYEGDMSGMSSGESSPGLLGWTQPAIREGVHNQILRTVRVLRKGR
ncbi:MAG: hypothetical protein P8J37_24795 [Fuerstiella sp.]|nr:hypothetical protein [Fuerstiella sp.]